MQKSLKLLLLLCLALCCQCQLPCQAYGISAGSTFIPCGTVTICNDDTNLYFEVQLLSTFQFQFDTDQVLINISSILPTGRGSPGSYQHHSGSPIAGNFWSLTVPISTATTNSPTGSNTCSSTFYVLVHVNVQEISTGQTNTAMAGSCYQGSPWYCAITYTAVCPTITTEKTCSQDPNQQKCWEWVCDTGYGYGNYALNSLTSIASSMRWGWAEYTAATVTKPLYVGAGQNRIDPSKIVGSVTYVYNPGFPYVDVQITKERCYAKQAHIFIGDQLPSDTSANGRFPFKASNFASATIPNPPKFVPDALGDGLWFIAHFDICCQRRSAVP